MAFGSKNDFFTQDKEVLEEYRLKLIDYLNLFNRDEEVIKLYLWAYDVCVEHPEYYDGATLTQDLGFGGLDVEALLHDVIYVVLHASVSFKHQWKADVILRSEMNRHGKSGFEIDKRWFLLLIKLPLFVPYAKYILKRRINEEDKLKIDEIFNLLGKNYKTKVVKDITLFSLFLFMIFSLIKTLINFI